VDVAVSSSLLGLVGGLVVALTALGRIPPWLGYPIGGALLFIYVLIVAAGLRASREFKRRPPPSSPWWAEEASWQRRRATGRLLR